MNEGYSSLLGRLVQLELQVIDQARIACGLEGFLHCGELAGQRDADGLVRIEAARLAKLGDHILGAHAQGFLQAVTHFALGQGSCLGSARGDEPQPLLQKIALGPPGSADKKQHQGKDAGGFQVRQLDTYGHGASSVGYWMKRPDPRFDWGLRAREKCIRR